jgi:hypothetical protein
MKSKLQLSQNYRQFWQRHQGRPETHQGPRHAFRQQLNLGDPSSGVNNHWSIWSIWSDLVMYWQPCDLVSLSEVILWLGGVRRPTLSGLDISSIAVHPVALYSPTSDNKVRRTPTCWQWFRWSRARIEHYLKAKVWSNQ